MGCIMTEDELNARYDTAMQSITYEKNRKSAQSFAMGAAILAAHDSLKHGALGPITFACKGFLVLFALFSAFYLAGQLAGV